MQKKNINYKVLKHAVGLLLVIFLLNIAVNMTYHWHVHKLQSGQVIAHSHPTDKGDSTRSPGKEHSHDQNSAIFFQHIFDLLQIGLIFFSLFVLFLLNKNKTVTNYHFLFFPFCPILMNKDRGPPQNSLSLN